MGGIKESEDGGGWQSEDGEDGGGWWFVPDDTLTDLLEFRPRVLHEECNLSYNQIDTLHLIIFSSKLIYLK